MTLVIAHRGASQAEPENTVAAFRRAVAMGAEGIELDVRRTADDRLVVHHDARLAGRAIRQIAAADLPAGLADLETALDACDGAFVNVEIKNDPDDPDHDPAEWVAHRVAIELGRRGGGARWLLSSFRFETVVRCRELMPRARTAWLVEAMGAAEIRRCAIGGLDAIHPRVDLLDEAHLRDAHIAGLAVNTWTCDDPERMRELMAWGVDGICTNVPDVAIELRRSALGSA